MDVSVLFADVRGSTGIAERIGAQAFTALLNRFYKAAVDVLIPRQALLDKMVGDEVVAFFLPVAIYNHREAVVTTAVELQKAVGAGSKDGAWLPLGVGVHTGTAFVGKVGSSGVYDFTALGDTMNTGARLQAEAKAGEVIVSDALYDIVAARYPGAESRTLHLRGREEPINVHVLRV